MVGRLVALQDCEHVVQLPKAVLTVRIRIRIVRVAGPPAAICIGIAVFMRVPPFVIRYMFQLGKIVEICCKGWRRW